MAGRSGGGRGFGRGGGRGGHQRSYSGPPNFFGNQPNFHQGPSRNLYQPPAQSFGSPGCYFCGGNSHYMRDCNTAARYQNEGCCQYDFRANRFFFGDGSPIILPPGGTLQAVIDARGSGGEGSGSAARAPSAAPATANQQAPVVRFCAVVEEPAVLATLTEVKDLEDTEGAQQSDSEGPNDAALEEPDKASG
ncbi:hypothetical protein CC1G_08535 [Coprinopsis cinerea okayama7|uniref:CCHC-type domain-containing protein n=1 Tax=Coprinopsis cinerea (strain Okayama-7 / 130 / ATCC MYA-4618 / FGSC 9003) TaxID=240176 RepID=A8ND60_COPC7|nr:hypothetical protein CC1G_08535 [Coprinopsis cinerea okayama7\|eukprot:XP_001832707.2 hypothetical protein CC1G_08535 [Coprinopsis cinerea okayama7\